MAFEEFEARAELAWIALHGKINSDAAAATRGSLLAPPARVTSGGSGASCSGKHRNSPPNQGALPPALSCSCRGLPGAGRTGKRGFLLLLFNTKSYFCPQPLACLIFLKFFFLSVL